MTRLFGSTWVRAVITVAILAWLATRLDMAEAARALARVDPWALLLVAALVALDRAVMIWRWILLLRATDAPIPARSAARIFLISSFVGGFLPAGVGSDAARAWALTRRTDRPGEAVASVAIDRILGVVALALLGAIGSVAWSANLAPELRAWVYAASSLALIASALSFWTDRLVRAVAPVSIERYLWGRRLLRLGDALGEYRRAPGVLASVLALSLLVQLLRITQAWQLGVGLDITVPFTYYLAFMPIGLLMMLLPISVSGFGLPQGVIVWLLAPQGVAAPAAFALSTLIVLSGIAGNIPGAWLYLRRSARGARDRRGSPSG